MKKYLIAIFILFCFLLLDYPGVAQISHGGTPLMNTSDFSAAKVLYLLDPEDPVILEGLKSKRFNTYSKAMQYAIERPVDLSPEMNGEWQIRNGMSIWRAHLISAGAFSVGVFFSEFELNKDARIFLYSPDGKNVKGSFTFENNKEFGSLFVGHIPGEEVIIELQVDNTQKDYGKLRVGLLSHAFLPVFNKKNVVGTGLGTSQDCEIDINCIEGDDWQVIKHSVCQITTPSLYCTGTLINNSSYNGKPYILTAEHCINKASYAERSIFYFGYENSKCDTIDALLDQSVSGSTMLATGDTLDFTLVELSAKPLNEYDVYFAGWDARERQHRNVVTLHHPNADAMKISKDFNSTSTALSVPGDLDDYIVASNYEIEQWDIGSTEGGSSGCPLFNTTHRLIGTLSGGLAKCGGPIGYDEENDRIIYSLENNRLDYFSKLSYNWDHFSEGGRQLKKWLDPTNSGQLSIGGIAMSALDVQKNSLISKGLKIFPNPSDGIITLELAKYTGKMLKVDVYDLTGRVAQSNIVSSVFPIQISLTEIPAGIYVIMVSGTDVNYSQRIMLK